jgi:hypothetical protein
MLFMNSAKMCADAAIPTLRVGCHCDSAGADELGM